MEEISISKLFMYILKRVCVEAEIKGKSVEIEVSPIVNRISGTLSSDPHDGDGYFL